MRRKTLLIPVLVLLMLFAAAPLMSLSVKAEEKLQAQVWGSQKKWASQFWYAYGQAYNSPTWPWQGILYSSGFQVDSGAYYSFTLPAPPWDISYLDIGIYGKALSGNGLDVYVWNWASSSWDFVATTPTTQGHKYWGVNPTNHVQGSSYEYRLQVRADDYLGNDDRYDMWYIDTYYQYTPKPYSVTIWSFLMNEGWISGVPITMDGVPTGKTTGYTFTGLTGTHTFTVPSYYAPYTASFTDWNPSGITSTTITVSSGGTWTARYTRQTTCSITVTSPNGGESWVRGTAHPITWTWSGSVGANVYIQLLKGGVVKGTITTANDGYYLWTIGTSNLGTDYQIRITSTSNSACTDISNNYFTITSGGAVGTITVISPNGGEIWKRGTAHPITWTWSGSVGANVYIQLLKGGVVKGTITTANDGYYLWTIGTSNLGTDYQIRITSTSNSAITDQSNNYFTITT